MPVHRIGVSVPPDLLEKFDLAMHKMGFRDRSKAIQAAMRNFITEFEFGEAEGEVAGAIIILFDHTVRGLEDSLTDIQHGFRDIINSTMHIHLNEKNCLEILAIKGKAELIKNLSQKISGVRGVKQTKLVTVHE
ncbi:MAG: nickel-responsive transcriptional regulator NikR [Candidatus Bathyarchaeia archaeon]